MNEDIFSGDDLKNVEVVNKNSEGKKVGRKIRIIENAYLETQKKLPRIISRIKGQNPPIVEKFDEPLLFLIREGRKMLTLEQKGGFKPGEFVIGKKNEIKKTLILDENKIIKWYYGGNYYDCWVANEEDMFVYPVTPVANSKLGYEVIAWIILTYRSLNTAKQRLAIRKWVIIVVGIIIVLFALKTFGVFDGGASAEVATNVGKSAVDIAKENISRQVSGIVVTN